MSHIPRVSILRHIIASQLPLIHFPLDATEFHQIPQTMFTLRGSYLSINNYLNVPSLKVDFHYGYSYGSYGSYGCPDGDIPSLEVTNLA